jgi:WD40-like Beta Propeller Repeat
MPDTNFEGLLSRQLREYAELAVRPIDRFAIAEKTIAGGRRKARWPLGVIARTDTIREVPWRPIAIAALLIVAAAAALVLIAGSQRRPGSDGLILFQVRHSVVNNDGTGTYCSTFHTIRPDGSGERQLLGDCVDYGNASWSPTGDGIIIGITSFSSSTTQIYEVAPDGGAKRVLLTLAGGYEPAFSPDGSQIAYVGLGSAPRSGGIIIAAADGTHPRQLTSTLDATKSVDSEPRFSPDGSRLVFTRSVTDPAGTTPGTFELWMVDADGSDLHRLTAGEPQAEPYGAAHWSPDGSHLLFIGSRSANGFSDIGLWTIDPDGTGLARVIPHGGGSDNDADWSPDGSRFVYTQFEVTNVNTAPTAVNSLRVMNADGSGITTLLSSSEFGQPDLYDSLDWGLPNTP